MAENAERASSRRLLSLRPIGQFIRPYWRAVLGASAALIVTAGATLAVGQAIRILVDQGFDRAAMLQSLEWLSAIVLVLTGGTFARFYLVSWVGERVSADLRLAVYGHLLRLDPAFFERNAAGEIQSRITTDTTLLQTLVGSSVSIALRNVLMGAGGLVLMVVSNPKLAAIVLLAVPLIVGPIIIYGRRVRNLSRGSQDTLAVVGAHVSESLQQIKVVKAFNREAADLARFTTRVEANFRVSVRRIRNRAVLTAIVMLLIFGAMVAMFSVGGSDVAAGGTSAGDLSAFLFYAVIVGGSVGALSEVYGDLMRAAGATERLMELLHAERDLPIRSDARQFKKAPRGELEFEHVTFNYPLRPDVVVLDDLSLQVHAGETIALVGPSGAGKSSIIELLLRFYDPNRGTIRVDGIDLRDLDPEQFRRFVALVPQQPLLFSGTLRENVSFGVANASDDQLAEVVRSAGLGEVVEQLPDGIDTIVGELGHALSGGQRQRVAVARALLKDPRILLLDEATSALDATSEARVQAALAGVAHGRTTIIVAHRLATIRNVPRIVVLEQGRIIAEGSHQQLMLSCPLYAQMASLQFAHGAQE